MLFALALVVAASATPVSCYRPAPGEIVAQRLTLRGRDTIYEAVSISRRFQDRGERLRGRMLVFGPRCARLFAHSFGNDWEVRFQTARLDAEPVLLATAVTPGASESGYHHVLLGYGRGLRELSPVPLENGDTGAIFVGNLGRGRGAGLARWDGIWAGDEAHYSPHRFEVTLYRWRHGRLERSAHFVTRNRLDAEPNVAARAMGFSFRDMTRRGRFALTNPIIEEQMRPDH